MKTKSEFDGSTDPAETRQPKLSGKYSIRLVSWNLLHTTGAAAEDVAAIIDTEQPDLVLMQEATTAIDNLPNILGGHLYHQQWPKKHHGLAVWAAEGLEATHSLRLPRSSLPGGLPRRISQLVKISGMTIANVHLSHGQVLNRAQLRKIATSVEGPLAIIGDYNALGPVVLKNFSDVGPRGATHQAQDLLPFRLDRCMVREIYCKNARSLDRGSSDHKPIAMTIGIN